jgi:hypothetical protein
MENLTWNEEFQRRLKAVAGFDPDVPVEVRVDGGQEGYCATCADYTAYVEYKDGDGHWRIAKQFDYFAGLLNAILEADPW